LVWFHYLIHLELRKSKGKQTSILTIGSLVQCNSIDVPKQQQNLVSLVLHLGICLTTYYWFGSWKHHGFTNPHTIDNHGFKRLWHMITQKGHGKRWTLYLSTFSSMNSTYWQCNRSIWSLELMFFRWIFFQIKYVDQHLIFYIPKFSTYLECIS